MSKRKPAAQKYQPKYIFWYEQDFSADEQVAYGMDWVQRHFYRALLQKAMICSTRPYLPTSDDQLWLLADAGSKERWIENKNPVMAKFQLVEIDGKEVWAHKRLLRDWDQLEEHHNEKVKAGRSGGFAKAKRERTVSAKVPAAPAENTTPDEIEADESAV
jgi:uncharacterized protein YdaU (DUF1376 family)